MEVIHIWHPFRRFFCTEEGKIYQNKRFHFTLSNSDVIKRIQFHQQFEVIGSVKVLPDSCMIAAFSVIGEKQEHCILN